MQCEQVKCLLQFWSETVEHANLTATGYVWRGRWVGSHTGAYSNGSPLMDESLPTGYSPNREFHHGECW